MIKAKVAIKKFIRTPRTRREKEFREIHSVDLLAHCFKQIAEEPEDCIVGCVTQVKEQGWCVARRAILASDFDERVPGQTINRLCASGLQAVVAGVNSIKAGQHKKVIVAGLEHMTRVPMFSDCGGDDSPLVMARYPDLVNQGLACERLAKKYGISREESDELSVLSHQRAAKSRNKSLISIEGVDKEGNKLVVTDDLAVRSSSTVEDLAKLRPVFAKDGILTAGNSSSIVDGAAAILLVEEADSSNGFIRDTYVTGCCPNLMLEGMVPAIAGLLERNKLSIEDIDFFEINEAFAPVALMTMKELKIPLDKMNVAGGAIALGHPLGATGVMLTQTVLELLSDQNQPVKNGLGIVSMCIGLGMGIATLVSRE